MTVREAEAIARRVAVDRVRKKDLVPVDPEIREFENKLNAALGTRVLIEKKENGGKVVIDFFNNEDLRHIIDLLEKRESVAAVPTQNAVQDLAMQIESLVEATPLETHVTLPESRNAEIEEKQGTPTDDSTPSDQKEDEDLYSIKNFNI